MSSRSIELSIGVGCPVKCPYCPQNVFLESYSGVKFLEAKNLQIILDNATFSLNPIEVFISGFMEPLAVVEWPNLLEIIYHHDLVSEIIMFTTGYQMTSEILNFLSKLPKIRLNFHINEFNAPRLLSKIKEIVRLPNKVVFRGVGIAENEFDNIKEVLKMYGAKFIFQEIVSRAGNMPDLDFKLCNHNVSCCKVNTEKRPVILPDGTALVCSNDYSCKMKIGNLITQKWGELDFDRIAKLQKNPQSNMPCFHGCHLANQDHIKIL
jgi:hypothetical protein